ncbi:hypothetical protein GCM10027360_19380 [Amycolatopsis echigonensis]
MVAWKVRSLSQYARTLSSSAGNDGWDGTVVSPPGEAWGYIRVLLAFVALVRATGGRPHGDETLARHAVPPRLPGALLPGHSLHGCHGPHPSGSTRGGERPVLPEAPR